MTAGQRRPQRDRCCASYQTAAERRCPPASGAQDREGSVRHRPRRGPGVPGAETGRSGAALHEPGQADRHEAEHGEQDGRERWRRRGRIGRRCAAPRRRPTTTTGRQHARPNGRRRAHRTQIQGCAPAETMHSTVTGRRASRRATGSTATGGRPPSTHGRAAARRRAAAQVAMRRVPSRSAADDVAGGGRARRR